MSTPGRTRIGQEPEPSAAKGLRRGIVPCLLALALGTLSVFLPAPCQAQTVKPLRVEKADKPAAAKVDYPTARELFRTGDYAACIETCTKGITAEPWSEAYRVLKIQAEMELGRYADAQKSFDEALTRFPRSILIRWAGRQPLRYNGKAEVIEQIDEEIETLLRGAPSQYSDTATQVVLGEYFLARGLDPKAVLDRVFTPLKKQNPNFVDTWLASGELALSKHDYALAADAFARAAKLDDKNPQAHFGLARAFLPSEAEEAQKAIDKALEINPNHVATLLLLVEEHIDSEDYTKADATLEKVSQINPYHPKVAAFRAVLAHLRNQPKLEELNRTAGLKHWTTNPEVDHTLGRMLSQKYRFAEGAKFQRQALAFDKAYRPAKMQLAQDLLRLGEEDEGWRLAGEISAEDGYNVVAHNLVTLRDNLEKFRTLEDGGFVLRMDAREAEIYGPRLLALLKRAKETLCAKYDVTLDKPITVEMFNRQQDFAIRTFGLPGGAGFLGVCFGTVITANSPASQGESPTCWESTLWHEFCHVVTLNKTHNKMPRWLSEGISVYEERQAHPTWGERMTPKYRQMLLGDDFTPLSELSGAFLSPKTPQHLMFAYYESSLAVEYLVETHGLDALKQVLVDLGNGLAINEALDRNTGGLEALDDGFAKYAREKAEAMAPEADWSEPELPRRADAKLIAEWLKTHPKNYTALQRLAAALIAEKKLEEAKVPLAEMRKLYPDDASGTSPYVMLAQIHRALNEPAEERAVLEELARRTDDAVPVLERLTELTANAEEWNLVRDYADRWLSINPLLPAPHRKLADAADKLGDHDKAIASYRALLLLDPTDPAETHYRLAVRLKAAGDLAGAKRHVLLSLEEAPRFREAHKLLLELVEPGAPAPAEKASGGR